MQTERSIDETIAEAAVALGYSQSLDQSLIPVLSGRRPDPTRSERYVDIEV